MSRWIVNRRQEYENIWDLNRITISIKNGEKRERLIWGH